MAKRILIMGSFDTKANELTFLRERVTELGFEAVCMDTSMGRESTVKVEICSSEVSTAAGVPVSEIRGSSDTRWATEVMAKGGAKIVFDLHGKKRLDGIVAIGGASNTGLSTKIMGALPFGVSKVMGSSMAAVPAYAGSYFGTKDITIIHSVVDIAGLIRCSRAFSPGRQRLCAPWPTAEGLPLFAAAKKGRQGSPSPNSSFLKSVPGRPRRPFPRPVVR